VHVHRTDPAYGAEVLSLAHVDHLLTETAIRAPAVRVARNGSVLPEPSFTRGGSLAGKPLTGLVDPVKLMRLHDEGATIVLQGLQRYWSPVGDLVAELELELGHPCQANAYLTPPGAQDAARAQESVSLHLTIGINQLTWRSLLTREVGRLLAEVPDEHLPAGYITDPGRLSDGLGEHLTALADAVRRLDPAALAAGQAEGFLAGRPPRLAGALLDRDALARGIAVDTRLRRRRGHPCELVDDGDAVRMLIGDRALRIPARVRPALEHVAAHTELTPADLAPLDSESALVLCRRLVREGLLEVAR
jgi:lysine-specific demethylase/histidyl-hydroxylase NO66